MYAISFFVVEGSPSPEGPDRGTTFGFFVFLERFGWDENETF